MEDYSTDCSRDVVKELFENITGQVWRAQAMLLLNAILAGAIVGIGAYGHRYRHYGFTRYLLLGSTTLFLPIISYVLSATGSTGGGYFSFVISDNVAVTCKANSFHIYMVIVSTCLVLISAINTSPIVATNDRSIHPPFELLVQGIWIVYLIVSTGVFEEYIMYGHFYAYLRFAPFALIHAKMALKCYAFLKAWKSFALRRNPRLIVGYMQQLRKESDQNDESLMTSEEDVNVPTPLLVMGEDELQVEKQPHGYIFRKNLEAVQGRGLVTIDRVWQLENVFMNDICLSFALFKLLRCRFARYKLTDVISKETVNFVRRVLLKDGEQEKAFRMIADELSFLHDYYDSQLPISSSDTWLTKFSIAMSLLSIGYCIFSGIDIITAMSSEAEESTMFQRNYTSRRYSILCKSLCFLPEAFGSLYFDLVPVLLLLVLVVGAEARDIAFHICSNWTKVVLTCRCVQRASLQIFPVIPKWVGFLLQCRCNCLLRHWNDKMRQTSLLVLHPRKIHQLALPGFLRRLLDRKKKNVGVPTAVKACIIGALRSTSNGGLSKGTTCLRWSQVGRSLVWACNNSKGTSDTILVWHIATTILEVKHPQHQHDDPPQQTPQGGRPTPAFLSDKKIAATHLSRYCAYLVESCPQLLPDDDAWSKHLYKKVKKDAERALATSSGTPTPVSSMLPEAGYRRLIQLLGATENYEVLKDGAKVAAQLGELTGGEEMAWELLAGFWSEMILYLAPSDNIKGHLQAIDRGGELITLLWALLTHVGIIDRPEDAAAAGAPSTGV